MTYAATATGTRLHTVATKGRYGVRVAVCGRTLPRRLSWAEIMEWDECQHCQRIINTAYSLVNPDLNPHDEPIHIPAHKIRHIAKQGVTSRQRQAMRRLQNEQERRAQSRSTAQHARLRARSAA